ncbi:hypothetical protein MVEN_02454800 [Mycena venus]|uniref:Uncharacterized protein n=1 Tax=Mycena venus TaxID=2733690 RepID=A0A8H7CC59_9AGAR|nr:hypothetical protein MVEN_02454800 [Mycena venus]
MSHIPLSSRESVGSNSAPLPSPSSLGNSQGSVPGKAPESGAGRGEPAHQHEHEHEYDAHPALRPRSIPAPLAHDLHEANFCAVPSRPQRHARHFLGRQGVGAAQHCKALLPYRGPPGAQRSPRAPAPLEPVMDELFSSLDDVYAEYHDGAPEGRVPVSINGLSAADDPDGHEEKEEEDIIADLDGEVGWRTTYSLEDEYEYTVYPESFFAPTFFSPMATLCPALHLASGESRTRPCPYSFLAERTQALGRYHVQGSRSLPDLAYIARVGGSTCGVI